MILEKDLKNKDYLEKVIKKQAENIISENRFREAYDLAKELTGAIDRIKNFKESDYELYIKYRDIIIKLRWVGLPIMTENMVERMFKYHFTKIFLIPEYDLWLKLRTVLLGINILDERDIFKKKLRDALLNNQEKITKKRLIINNQEKDSTIANWFYDYNKTLGTGRASTLARTQYLTNGENIKKLSEDEKERVKLLFNIYERLKLSSQTLEGLEEDIPVDEENLKGVVREGIFEPLPKMTAEQELFWQLAEETIKERETRENSLRQLRSDLNQYPPNSLERKAIEEEIRKMNTES